MCEPISRPHYVSGTLARQSTLRRLPFNRGGLRLCKDSRDALFRPDWTGG